MVQPMYRQNRDKGEPSGLENVWLDFDVLLWLIIYRDDPILLHNREPLQRQTAVTLDSQKLHQGRVSLRKVADDAIW